MPITWIIGGIISIALVVGAGLFKHGYDESKIEEGRAECRQAIADANAKASKAANALTDEAVNHLADLELADKVIGEKAAARVVYVTKKGASDVAAHPEVFGNAACTLPTDALRNLNAARAGLRRDPPADVMRVDVGAGPSPAARPPADSSAIHEAVRGTNAAAKGDDRGNVPADAAGRRPMGKVRP